MTPGAKYRSVRSALVIVLSCGLGIVATAALQSQQNDERVLEGPLVQGAQALLELKYKILVEGSVGSPVSNQLVRIVDDVTAEYARQRASLIADGVGYTRFTTDVIPRRVKRDGIGATLEATEHTTLQLASSRNDALAPKVTESFVEHRFHFVYWRGVWELERDELINWNLEQSSGPLPLDDPPSSSDATSESSRASTRALTPTIDRAAIVAYARRYAKDGNPSYRRFGNDCTNFASQCMLAGRWSQVTGTTVFEYNLLHLWFYGPVVQSRTWVNANDFFRFAISRPRAIIVTQLNSLLAGDVIAADWDRDGQINHLMIVTQKDSSGRIYLTYRSDSYVDSPMTSVQSRAREQGYPNPFFYGLQLYAIIN